MKIFYRKLKKIKFCILFFAKKPSHFFLLFKSLKKYGLYDTVAKFKFIIFKAYEKYNAASFLTPSIRHKKLKPKKSLAIINSLKLQPVISIIIPLHSVDMSTIQSSINPIQKQIYPNWEIFTISQKPVPKKIKNIFSNNNSNDNNQKIHFIDNTPALSAYNKIISTSINPYILFLLQGIQLTGDALFEYIKVLNSTKTDFIYSDHGILKHNQNKHYEPYYKPDFSKDMLLSMNYIGASFLVNTDVVQKIKNYKGNLIEDKFYDYILRLTDISSNIYHIKKVLYLQKIKPSNSQENEYSEDLIKHEKKALDQYITRNKIKASVIPDRNHTYRIKYKISSAPLVSILIPFKDKPELLKKCIDSIINKSTYTQFEIIGISNNSSEKETISLIEKYSKTDSRINFYEYNIPFNYSKLNNFAAAKANGKHLVLLNNDIEIITREWIENLLEHSQRDEVGAVGAKLYYPDNTIQHAGVIYFPEKKIIPTPKHIHRYFPSNHNGYLNRLNIIQNVSAVTAACMMFKSELYKKLGGLNEKNLAIAYNDVDFCLRLREIGYTNIFTPYCEAYHYESVSRGFEDTPEKIKRFKQEGEYLAERHRYFLENGDPYFNKNIKY